MAHEHEHEHEHKHGPDCACGCNEGGRGHGSEPEHEHGHDHERHDGLQETYELEWGCVELEAHAHDQAATVSMSLRPHDGCSIAFSDLVGIMQAIAHASEGAGGIVGHIKGLARQGSQYAHVSVTAADLAPTVEGDPSLLLGAGATIQLVAIVLLVDQTHLLSICKNALAY